jgi:hypothetical protein
MLVRLLLCGVLLSLPQAIAQNVSLRLSSANAVAESEVSLDLILTSSGGVRPASIQWKVEYSTRDFALSDVKIGPAATAAGKTLTCQGQAGQRSCVLTGLAGGQVNSNLIGDGVVARVVLYVNPGAVLAAAEVKLSGAFAASAVGDAINVNVTPGTVTIGKPTVGSLSEITCNPTWIVAPGSADCSVVLNGPAPSGGLPIKIETSDAILTAPSSVTISSGNTHAAFKVSTGPRPGAQGVTLLAQAASGPQLSVKLTLAPPIQLSSMTCAPQPLSAGSSSICTVFLRSPTPPPGASIEVRSNSTKVAVPVALSVRSGRSSVRFRADADPLATSEGVRLTSEYRGSSVSTTLSVAGATNPVITVPGDQAVIHGSKLEFPVSAKDPNNLPVTLSVIGLPVLPIEPVHWFKCIKLVSAL